MDVSKHSVRNLVAVIDDNDGILDALQLMLEIQGWSVRTYRTGEDFLSDLNDQAPMCLILDPHLPGMSGDELVRLIATSSHNIPIIGLTARPNSAISRAMGARGVVVMLTKPVSGDELLKHIGSILVEHC